MDLDFSSLFVQTHNGVEAFFDDVNPEKPQCERLLSYLEKFGLIRDNWNQDLKQLVDEYNSYLSEALPQPDPTLVRDIPRSQHEFFNILSEFKLEGLFDIDRVKVIFQVIKLTVNDFEYYQGFDRIVYFSIAFSLKFCQRFSLKNEICEAFAYHIAKHFFQHIVVNQILLSNSGEEFYLELSRLFYASDLDLYQLYSMQKLIPRLYAQNWLLNLFIDAHPINWAIIILDQIVKWSDHHFLQCLTIAHCKQIPLGLNYVDSLSHLLQCKEFHVPKLLFDANQIMKETDFEKLKNFKISDGKPISIFPWTLPILGIAIVIAIGAYLFWPKK